MLVVKKVPQGMDKGYYGLDCCLMVLVVMMSLRRKRRRRKWWLWNEKSGPY